MYMYNVCYYSNTCVSMGVADARYLELKIITPTTPFSTKLHPLERVRTMDIVLAVRQYISRMISESGAGMKVLLMDSETVSCSTGFICCGSDDGSPLLYSFSLFSLCLDSTLKLFCSDWYSQYGVYTVRDSSERGVLV